MDEDIFLPTLTHSDPSLPEAPPVSRFNSRKRSARSYELQDDGAVLSTINTSSDPALFSSDETPDAENYTGSRKRHKRKFKGTWWAESGGYDRNELSGSGRRKRQFQRNLDSGIFMGSDDGSTELSSDSSFGAELIESYNASKESARNNGEQNASEMRKRFTARLTNDEALTSIFEKLPRAQLIDPKQHQVRNIVRRCVEEGKEDIDLSGLALQDLPLDLGELTTMIRVGAHASSQEPHSSLEASPRLYLGNNSMRQFPSAVLDLTNLRLLSLRQNKLTSLPAGIRSLINLQILNVSGNKLQHLPWEVLGLIRHHSLTEINSEPNPWIQRDQDRDEEVRESTANGSLRPAGQLKNPKMPFLSELVLRQLAKVNVSRSNLKTLMPADTSSSVLDMLDTLHNVQMTGGLKCSSTGCGREMVIARRRTIEYWDVRREVRQVERYGWSASPNSSYEPQFLPFGRGFCGQCQFSDTEKSSSLE